jgi:hypothetical protein
MVLQQYPGTSVHQCGTSTGQASNFNPLSATQWFCYAAGFRLSHQGTLNGTSLQPANAKMNNFSGSNHQQMLPLSTIEHKIKLLKPGR